VNAFTCVYEANETQKNGSSFLLILTILEVAWEVCLAEQHIDEYIGTQGERNNRFVKICIEKLHNVYPASNRNECQKQNQTILGSRVRPALKADKLTAICEPIV
jgi:hypothetical protein